MQKQNSLTFQWLFPDQIQFFTDQNNAVLQPICLLAANKWQIPYTSSLKCISLILQINETNKIFKQFLGTECSKINKFSLFRASEASERKNQHFFHISSSQNTC